MALIYTYNGIGYTVTNSGGLPSSDITIPSTYNGPQGNLSVTEIGVSGFRDQLGLSGIILPDTITKINREAFRNCINLTGINFGTGLRRIASQAFNSASKLNITGFPSSLTGIDYGAFTAAHGIINLTFNGDITMDASTFYNCIGLKSVRFNKSYNSTGFYNTDPLSYGVGGNFAWCYNLTGVYINSGYIGPLDFWRNDSLNEVTLGTGVKGLGGQCFASAYNLTKINLENTNISEIPEQSFYGMQSLKTLTIPNSVTGIRANAFVWSRNIDTLTFGTGVKIIDTGIFAYANLNKIVFLGNYPQKIANFDASFINKIYRANTATGWSNITTLFGWDVALLDANNQYKIALPYTGFNSTDFKLLPSDKSSYNVYDTRNFSIGLDHDASCENQAYSLILGGASNRFKQDKTNYPWSPKDIRFSAGSGSGIGSAIIGGTCNIAYGDYAVVLGGSRNCAYQLAGAVFGGLDNEVGGNYNAVVNGNYNCISSGTSNSVILGGTDNIIDKDNIGVAILGGLSNRIAKNSSRSLILGGAEQVIGGEEPNMFGTVNYACGLKGSNACYSYIIGGYSNTIWSGNCYSTILGGSNNQINATKAEGKGNAPSTGWSHIIVSQSSRVCSNLSFILGGDSAVIETGANRSFVLGSNAKIEAPYSFVLGGTAVTIPPGHDCSAVISHVVNNKNVSSRGAKTLLLNFDSGVYISNKLQIEGPLVLPYLVTPTKPDSAGEKGQIAIDEKYIYVCDRSNHWVRTALAEWEDKEAKPSVFDFYITTYKTGAAAFDEDVKSLGFNLGNLVTRYYPSINKFIPTSYVTESGYYNDSSRTTVRPLFAKNYNSVSLDPSGVTWSINPPLGGGLSINSGNGIITGIVTGISFQTGQVYTVTATNSQGSYSKELGIWYYPYADNSIALLENKQKQVTTYWVQGCGFGCGCQGGVGYYATTTVNFYVIDTTTLNDFGDIRIRTYGAITPNLQISYSTGIVDNYTGMLNIKTNGNYSPTINYNVPYIDSNIKIKIELYNSVTGDVNNTIYTYYYNPVKAESNF